jgi:Flp pilus assembly protein TadB
MADVAVIIGAVGGAAAALITSVSAFMSARNTDRLKSQELRLEQMKLDQERMAKDLGQRTRDVQDALSTIDDRTQSTQRLTEGIALATGNTPLPAITSQVRGPPPPPISPVAPIPSGSQGGFKRG